MKPDIQAPVIAAVETRPAPPPNAASEQTRWFENVMNDDKRIDAIEWEAGGRIYRVDRGCPLAEYTGRALEDRCNLHGKATVVP